jgi:methylisocitrate lyase
VDAGADMIFPEGLTSEEELARFAESMSPRRKGGNGPYLLANMTEFGKTPILPVTTFESMGYDLVIFPVTTLRIAMKAVRDALRTIKREGSVESILQNMQTRAELYESIGYTPGTPWEFPS